MSRFPVFILAVALAAVPGQAMFEEDGASVRAEGMAGAFTAVADDASAAWYNPGGLVQVEGPQFHGFYKLLYGGVGVNLHSGHAGFAMPVRKAGTFCLAVQETGFELHSERTVRMSHGFELARDIGFGYGLTGYNVFQKGAGPEKEDLSGFGFGLDLGVLARIYRVWTAGFMVRNLNQPKIGEGPEAEVPVCLRFGLGFHPGQGIHSALDVDKEPGKSTNIRVGQEFRIIRDHLVLRAGVQTSPVQMAFGLRTGLSNVHLDYALKTHSILPMTHDLGVMLEF